MGEFTNNILIYAAALVVTLGVLIAFHEFGHYWVARKLGVKVLRYSVGFGKPLWLRRRGPDRTEYVIGAIPLGGYVKMLDEREAPVDAAERGRAFNRQSVWSRIAIVAAGPLANFIFAIAAFAAVYMLGVNASRPLFGPPAAESAAAAAGFQDLDLIVAVDGEPTPTLDAALLALVDQASAGDRVRVEVDTDDGRRVTRTLDLSAAGDVTENGRVLQNLGLNPWRPKLPVVIDRLVDGSAGQRAGLLPGDRVVEMNGEPVDDWMRWSERVRASVGQELAMRVRRGGDVVELTLTPDAVTDDQGNTVGRIGAYPYVPEEPAPGGVDYQVLVQYGPLAALWQGAVRTWDMSWFTLRMLGRMLVGKVSLDNISGPITIAQFAGQSAMIGLTAFITFMAMVSISLGVLNLLPVPVLDGGHLLYYFIEIIKGSPVSENVQYVGQQIGVAAIVGLMGLALFNDVARLNLSWMFG